MDAIEKPDSPLWHRIFGSFSHSLWSLKFVWETSPAGALGLIALTLCSATLAVAAVWTSKCVVDAVVATLNAASAAAREQAEATAVYWVTIEFFIVAAIVPLERVVQLVRDVIGSKLHIRVNLLILEKALTLELAELETSEFRDKLLLVRNHAGSRPLSLLQGNLNILRNGLTLAGYATILISFSGWVVAGLFLATIPVFVVETKFSGAEFRHQKRRSTKSRRLTYIEHLLTNASEAKEIKLFDVGPRLLRRYKRLSEIYHRENIELGTSRLVWLSIFSVLSTLSLYACYVLIAMAAARGQLSLGTMALYVTAFRQGQGAFRAILSTISAMYEDNLYMANLQSYMAMPVPDPSPAAHLPATTEKGLRFEGVGFRYPGKSDWSLRDVSIHIPPGQHVGLLGTNGSGKSTLIKLAARLYEPTEGRIFLDGRDLRLWPSTDLRDRMSVVFQDFTRYQMTLGENVSIGAGAYLHDKARLSRAIESSDNAGLVVTLQQGCDTQLGRWFPNGTELSGGQWQKVALARVFMREEADILILDEPTAALDAEAEDAIFDRFEARTLGRTAILVSHRFPALRRMDRIVVLERGRIVECGTHVELLAARGRYADLFSLQAHSYR